MAGNGEATQKQVEEAVNRLVDAADKVGDALDEAGFEDVGEGLNEMAQQARQIQQDAPWLWEGLAFGIAAVARHLRVADCQKVKCNNRKLRRETGNDCDIPDGASCQAHHIIPCEIFGDDFAVRLCELGFDLNGAGNGVMLPCCEYGGRKAAYHTGRTPSAYIAEVRRRFRLAAIVDDPDDDKFLRGARAIIGQLRRKLCVGNTEAGLPLNDDSGIRNCDRLPRNTNCKAGCG